MKMMDIFSKILVENGLSLKYSKILIWRGINADTIDDIEFDNLGVHWSVDRNVAETMDTYMSTDPNKKSGDLFVISSFIDVNDINTDATVESNSEHPNEYEIVVNKNVQLDIDVYNMSGDLLLSDHRGNSGDRSDRWVEADYNHTPDEFDRLMMSFYEWADTK